MASKSWFEQLVGFPEHSPDDVRQKLIVEDDYLTSTVNKRRFRYGRLDIPCLAHLKAQTEGHTAGKISVRQIVGDARALHLLPETHLSTIQVASQFNLLEMIFPIVTPEMGVSRYEFDHTQGPSCAVSCGAGTIYRNYFAHVNGGVGQSKQNQIDTIKEFGDLLGNEDGAVWTMQNGYALGNERGVERASAKIVGMCDEERDELRDKVRIGVQYGTEVTIGGSNVVTQAYCSAFPVGYCDIDDEKWMPLATLLLEASYESTLRAAVVNWKAGGTNKVYLTLVGGGVFRNCKRWILNAMKRAFEVMEDSGLDIRIVSYRVTDMEVEKLAR